MDNGTKNACIICKVKFWTSTKSTVCDKWDCKLAERKCHQWGVPLSQYHAEKERRNQEQRRIDSNNRNLCRVQERLLCY